MRRRRFLVEKILREKRERERERARRTTTTTMPRLPETGEMSFGFEEEF